MNEGWLKLYYKLAEWEWYGDPNMVATWIHLLISANWKDKKWRGVTIKRGQLITSRAHLAEEIGISEQQTRTCLERLQSTGAITSHTTNRYTIITICKYDSYQDKTEYEQPATQPTEQPTNNQQITSQTPTNNQQITTTKDYKEVEEREERKNILIPSPNARAREIGIEKYGSFSNVYLHPAEHRTLVMNYGEEMTEKAVDDLSCKIAEGDEQANSSLNHYATLDRWLRYKIEKSAKAPMSSQTDKAAERAKELKRMWEHCSEQDRQEHLEANNNVLPWEDPKYNEYLKP